MGNYISYNVAQLRNQFDSHLYAVRLDTNNTCNLKCIYCGINDPNHASQFMSLEQFNPPARLFFFSKSKYVSLTFGTEPLMFKDFHLFINELDKYAIPSTHFITNGLFLIEYRTH